MESLDKNETQCSQILTNIQFSKHSHQSFENEYILMCIWMMNSPLREFQIIFTIITITILTGLLTWQHIKQQVMLIMSMKMTQ